MTRTLRRRLRHPQSLPPSQLPGDDLFELVEYADGTDEAFLSHLWRDLYGDETP
jgi:hypothetical protein